MHYDGWGSDLLRYSETLVQAIQRRDFEVDDTPHPKRLPEVNLEVLKQLIEEEPRSTIRCLAERVGCSHTAV